MALSNSPLQCFDINIMHCCHGRLCHMPILTDFALLQMPRYIVVSPSRRSRLTSAGFPLHVLALFVLAWVGICSEPCPHSTTTTQTSVAVRVNCVTVATILDEYIWRFAEREKTLRWFFFQFLSIPCWWMSRRCTRSHFYTWVLSCLSE